MHQLPNASIFFARIDVTASYLRAVYKYGKDACIVQPEVCFKCGTRFPDVLVQCKHGLTDKSGRPFDSSSLPPAAVDEGAKI